ncbi:tetratricopeptide repeat protein [Psychroserpens sp. BH13MA-6]
MKRSKKISFVLLLVTSVFYAQNEQQIDSLKNVIQTTKVDSVKALNHLKIAQLSMNSNPDATKNNLLIAEDLYKKSASLRGLANLNSVKAQYMFTQNKYDSAMAYVESAGNLFYRNGDSVKGATIKSNLANIVRMLTSDYDRIQSIYDEIEPIAYKYQDTSLIAIVLSGKSDIALHKGHRNIAIALTKEVIKLKEAQNDSMRLPQEYFRIGKIYQELFDFEASISNLDEGITIAKATSNLRMMPDLLRLKGTSQIKLKQFEVAKKSLEEALSISKTINSKTNELQALIRLGLLEVDRENFEKADDYVNQAQSMMTLTNTFSVDYNYNLIKGRISLGQKQYRTAIDYFQNCVDLAEKNESLVNLSFSKKFQSLAMEKLGDYKNALALYKESSDAKDSLTSQLRTALAIEQKIIFETEQKEKAIALQKKDIEILKQKEQAGKLRNNILIIAILSLLIIASLLFYAIRQKMKKNKVIRENLNKDLEYKTKELTTHALHLAKKNEVLNDLKEKAKVFKADTNADPGYQMLIQTINFDLQDDNNWENFRKYFEEVHKDFNANAQKKYPNITPNDLRLMALLKMNLSSKEIANILNISSDGIKKARQRLRKKMGINPNDSLEAIVIAI